MSANPPKLGFAPTRRNVFDRVEARRYKDMIEDGLRKWKIDFVNLDFLNDEGLLFQMADAKTVADRFTAEGVDAVFIPHCNFGTEDAAAKLCSLVGKPVLLWGPRDDAPRPDGSRIRDSQCGLFATSKALRRYGVPFTYVPNTWIDGPELEHGVKAFMKVAAACKAFNGARIGQIGPRPKLFASVMVNESELLERFGIEIVPATLIGIERGVKDVLSAGGDELKALVDDLKSRFKFPKQSDEAIAIHAATIIWIRRWAAEENLQGVTLQCWSDLQRAVGIWPCFVNGELTGSGLPSTCETDVHAAVTAVILQQAAAGATFCADLTIRHPDNDNSELLWHCGPFPSCLAREGCDIEVIGYEPENKVSGLAQFRAKDGPVTVSRFDGDHGDYRLFFGHARTVDGPHNRGTYAWVEVDNWLDWEEKLIYGPYIHHVTGAYDHVGPILHEFCRYVPGLEPDPAGLADGDFRSFWRGMSR
ncbi:MAG: L-fucose/L-arabinose isomerase family protein [Planctomycetes bacterium]|nr:L-fucose/L-arabinose isomerase family protein [Planctomycetota bacterium]